MAYKCSNCKATDKNLYYVSDDERSFYIPDSSVEGYNDENQLMKCKQCLPKGTFMAVKTHNYAINQIDD